MQIELALALDYTTADEASHFLDKLGNCVELVSKLKVGLQLIHSRRGGYYAANLLRQRFGRPIFYDAKLHDVPGTSQKTARQIGGFGVDAVTMWLSGDGSSVAQNLADGARLNATANPPKLWAVSVLSSDYNQLSADIDLSDSYIRLHQHCSYLASGKSSYSGIVVPAWFAIDSPDKVAELATSGITVVAVGARLSEADDARGHTNPPTLKELRGTEVSLLVLGSPITSRINDPVRALYQVLDELS